MTTTTINTLKPANDLGTSNFKLKDIIKSLPKECFAQNRRKAWIGVLTNVLMVGLGYWSLAIAPWFLLPIAWIFTGTALTGFFVIGHDCGHRSFAKRRWVNDLVGHLIMMPLIYPFHSWRIQHNYHHAHTNELEEDNAWHPIRPKEYESWGKLYQWGFQLLMGKRLWWIGSILHWFALHFDWTKFRAKDQSSVKLSVAVVVLFAAVVFPLIFATIGIWGFIKFWFIPWLVFHFWMSTFTLVHHTAPEIPFVESTKWNPALAQLSGTVHCDYPRWVEFLCHDINVHVPHHISTAIPSYNLRLAHRSLKENWGNYLYPECRFSWSLITKITDKCHLYTTNVGYQSFKDYYAARSTASRSA
ncbi:fatty acid desaturase [Chlorogloeopsis fritschii PCC 6912]|jgi:acyl-lipid omega-6 desaturase (Delta-12 desaturase)|uniref:Fatty acid desaturase n=1 Tax=Chlorogloeopsis fritschii PCC 6912 TaxID=211165 RepID=A0A433NS69_CHLFR|nr:fatty acid desaturase [Chlorogloeopsis fritschii]MBF2004601.1 fatty acid desaturase [Chlorogloeopsis fritschii C42_A2020_084]RUR87044.1 fatty acid desaturase [Chlorogloeopsis fritschii PCC 6912]